MHNTSRKNTSIIIRLVYYSRVVIYELVLEY